MTSIDQSVLLALYHLAVSSPLFSLFAIVIAQWLPYVAFGFFVVYELFNADIDRGVFHAFRFSFFPILVAWTITLLVKFFVNAPRPFVGDLDIAPLVFVPGLFDSFPSAHATVMGALFGAIFALRLRFWKWYGVIAILVALGRVAVGVHWPHDVLVGLLFGLLVGYVGARLLRGRQ